MNQVSKTMCEDSFQKDFYAVFFCEKFLHGKSLRYVFGCNEWASSIAEYVDLDGFVDDFIDAAIFCGKPVINSQLLPDNAMVVSAIVGEQPITAQRRIAELSDQGVLGLDYYAFRKYSGLPLKEVTFLGEFDDEFNTNYVRFEWVFRLLSDNESRRIYSALLNFRLSRNLLYMQGFVDSQDHQYFENFLNLQVENEVFVDVGSFDGYTSEEFIKRCPNYSAIHIFEPEPSNMEKVKAKLGKYQNICYHQCGASSRAQVLKFNSDGSSSSVSNDGKLSINVDRIDDLVQEPFSFLKMDIEGGEAEALLGASLSIGAYHPRLAICVYHKADDLWRIPELVLSFRDDYDLYLRHYTEGVTETVMFFIPKG